MIAMLIVIGVPDYKYASWYLTVNLIPFQDFTSSNILGMVLECCHVNAAGSILTDIFFLVSKVVSDTGSRIWNVSAYRDHPVVYIQSYRR